MTTLYEIIRDAHQAVDEYKNPDLDEFRKAVDPVLAALGQATVDGDHVESIYAHKEYFQITTTYSCLGCSNSNTHTIPMDIVNAVDPVRAATEKTLRAKLTKAIGELNYARARIPKFEEASQNSARALAEFLKEDK